jgi:hypothetical protein
MAYYRLSFMNGPSGRIQEFREFEANDDCAALRRAADWRTVSAMELWCGGRKVRTWDGLASPHARFDKSSELRANWRSR